MITLRDHYGQALQVGDFVLGAKGGGRFRETQFIHSIVIGRTECMVRLHQVGSKLNVDHTLEDLERRNNKGGKVFPCEVIRLQQQAISPAVIEKHLNKTKGNNGTLIPCPFSGVQTV